MGETIKAHPAAGLADEIESVSKIKTAHLSAGRKDGSGALDLILFPFTSVKILGHYWCETADKHH